ncbi:hypothetical protein QZH41_004569 [Actinostola sp. cb2023]|nr:hypothetical protein QZH41_004569 [Actinostola sp. cb2023]
MSAQERAKAFVDAKIASDKVVVFSKTYCPFCTRAKDALNDTGVKYTLLEIEDLEDVEAIQDYLRSITKIRSVPQVFIGGKFIADGSKTRQMKQSGELQKILKECGAL